MYVLLVKDTSFYVGAWYITWCVKVDADEFTLKTKKQRQKLQWVFILLMVNDASRTLYNYWFKENINIYI